MAEIGFIGLGNMGGAMAAPLGAVAALTGAFGNAGHGELGRAG